MAELDGERLLAFLHNNARQRDVHTTSQLVIASIYAGLATRITNGEFDKEKERDED